MANKCKIHWRGGRYLLSSTLLVATASASAVTVDGNLSDLQTAIANEFLSPSNVASGTESGSDAGGGGTYGVANSGFDIVGGQAWYDVVGDTFYIGMNVLGQVGTSGDREGALSLPYFTCSAGYGNARGTAGVFDGCETYGFAIDVNSDAVADYTFNIKGESIANSGEGTEQAPVVTNDALGLGAAAANWAVSESFNGIEFSLTGLKPLLEPFGVTNPRSVTIYLYAGSGSNRAAEDTFSMQMQVVPVPAAVWLFGSGLVGLLGAVKKRRAA